MSMWKRYKRQEGGNVYRWYEKGETIASIVKGYFSREANIRISGRGFNSIEVRGHKDAIFRIPENLLFKKFDNYIKSEKQRKRKPLRRKR